MKNINEGYDNLFVSVLKKWKEVKTNFTHFIDGDIGIAKITPCFQNRKSVIFDCLNNKVGAGTTELNILRPFSKMLISEYILYFSKSEYLIKYGIQNFTGAVGQQRFGGNVLKNTLIPIPPFSEQEKICNFIKQALVILNYIENEEHNLYKLIEQAKYKILDNFFGENSCYKSYYEKKYKIGDILKYEQPAQYIVKSTDYSDTYETPVLTPGKTFILGYTNEKDGIYCVKSEKVIIFDDFTTASKLIDFNFKVKSSAMKILTISDKDLFDIDYMYYLLQTIKVNSDTHKRYWISEFMPKIIKVHTLGEQKRIATTINNCFAILDSISSSI